MAIIMFPTWAIDEYANILLIDFCPNAETLPTVIVSAEITINNPIQLIDKNV